LHIPRGVKYDINKSTATADAFISNVKKKWNPLESQVLGYISRVSGLKWKRKEITCYVPKISWAAPFSDPLTIPITTFKNKKTYTKSVDRFIDVLTHELIHNIFIDNEKELHRYFKHLIHKKYKRFKFATAIHVPLHAIHEKVFHKFFSRNRLKSEINFCKNWSAYNASWEIVLKEGNEAILKDLKTFLAN